MKKKIFVNLLTSLRLVGTILMIPIFINFGGLVAAITAGVILATDCLDGYFARKLHVETFFGSMLDSLSDKTLAISILGILSTINPIFLLSILLECGIFGINMASIKKGNNCKSRIIGKVKTVMLDITMVASLLLMALNELSLLGFLSTNINDLFLVMNVPTLTAQTLTVFDYVSYAHMQDKKRIAEIKQIENTLELIELDKERLNEEKKELQRELKNKEQLTKVLFDTEYYHQHKNDGIKKLLYTFKEEKNQ